MKPGIHQLGSDQYHADPCDRPSLSASLAHVLLSSSPKHAWTNHPRLNPLFEKKEEARFDLGRACHALLLEGNANVEVFDYADWRTNASKEDRELARQHGKTPMLRDDWEACEAMVGAVKLQLPLFNVSPPLLTDGQPEQTIVWEEAGVLCRARLDWLRDDMTAIDDFKSTSRSASPESFAKTIYSMGYHVQARMYQRAVASVTGSEPAFRFIAAETAPPFEMSVFSLTPAGEKFADDQIESVLATWKRCLATDEWPGYTRRVCYAEPPGWAETAWLEREAMVEAA